MNSLTSTPHGVRARAPPRQVPGVHRVPGEHQLGQLAVAYPHGDSLPSGVPALAGGPSGYERSAPRATAAPRMRRKVGHS